MNPRRRRHQRLRRRAWAWQNRDRGVHTTCLTVPMLFGSRPMLAKLHRVGVTQRARNAAREEQDIDARDEYALYCSVFGGP